MSTGPRTFVPEFRFRTNGGDIVHVRTIRKMHRWLGIVVGIQLLFWTGSGLFFALNPIAKVRGETEQAEAASLGDHASIASPDEALAELRRMHGDIDIMSVLLRPHLQGTVYEIAFRDNETTGWAMADAASGRLRDPIGRDEAVALARADFAIPAEVETVEHLTTADADSEYRGRPGPPTGSPSITPSVRGSTSLRTGEW